VFDKIAREPCDRRIRREAISLLDGREYSILCFFEKGNYLLTRDGWESFEEILDRITTFEVIDQILDPHAGSGETGRAAHDFRIDFDD